MRLISLNLWGGRIWEPLAKFLRECSNNIDIFCFQEIYNEAKDSMSDDLRTHKHDLFNELQKILSGHKAFFRPVISDVYGVGIFVNKSVPVLEEGEIILYSNPNYSGHGGSHSRNLQW